jgi:hypothetical protein
MQQNIALQSEVLEIAMKLESSPMGESSSVMNQILSQLTILSLQVKDRRKTREKIKENTSGVSDANQKAMTRSIVPYFTNTWTLEPRAL